MRLKGIVTSCRPRFLFYFNRGSLQKSLTDSMQFLYSGHSPSCVIQYSCSNFICFVKYYVLSYQLFFAFDVSLICASSLIISVAADFQLNGAHKFLLSYFRLGSLGQPCVVRRRLHDWLDSSNAYYAARVTTPLWLTWSLNYSMIDLIRQMLTTLLA